MSVVINVLCIITHLESRYLLVKDYSQQSCNYDDVGVEKWFQEGYLNPVSANPTKWPNTIKQFVGNSRRIVWVYLIIL